VKRTVLVSRSVHLAVLIGAASPCVGFPTPGRAAPESASAGQRHRVEIPSFTPAAAHPTATLPALRVSDILDTARPATEVRVLASELRVVGNQSLRPEQLDAVLDPFRGRALGYADLELIRDLLTLEYVRNGFIASRVELPDQTIAPRGGVILFRTVEGRIGEIEIETDGSLNADALRAELRLDPEAPLYVPSLERRLQHLRRNPRIRRLDVELVPDRASATSTLRVRVDENPALSASFELDNAVTPLVGGEAARIAVGYRNLWNRGHEIEGLYTRAAGLRSGSFHYRAPLGTGSTHIEVQVAAGRAEIVSGAFRSLDIESRSATYRVAVTQGLLDETDRELELSLAAEHRRSKSFLLGEGLGAEDGLVKLSVLRLGQRYRQQGTRFAFGAESIFSLGFDALRATQLSGDQADGSFFKWQGRIRYVYDLAWQRAQLVLRGEAQLAERSLPGLERIGVGGRESVRGYRESALVRDNGVVGAIELRIPVYGGRNRSLELAPHVDIGYAWNESRELSDHRLLGAGLTARFRYSERLSLVAGFAADLKRIERDPDRDLQDRGFHFGFVVRY